MSFPRYPDYKDSRVEWLGSVPKHWDVQALKRNFKIVGGSTPKSENESFWDGEILWATPTDLGKTGSPLLDDTQRKITLEGLASCNTSLVPKGSIILSTRAPIGSIGIADRPMCTNQGCKSLVPFENTDTNYFSHLLSISSTELNIRGKGSTFLELSGDELGAFKLPVPSLSEQTLISKFLDRETAKIDGLVNAQKRLMELLKEKRQTVISHAVTKGINPDAPMKPSQIEWLNEIPSHWRVVQVKHLARDGRKTFTDGDWIESPHITEEGVRLIQTGNVGIGFYKEQGYRFVSEATFEELHCTEVFPGDVLICRLDGPVGRACLAPDLGGGMITSVDNAILKPAEDVAAGFVVALFSSAPWLSWIDALCRVGGGFRLRISRSQLGEIRVPLPPIEEQTAIIRFLAIEAGTIDALTAEAQRAIELLQERRTALISAAVTGQIDVRTFAKGQPT
jgi:type I restriction enzyme S subunit